MPYQTNGPWYASEEERRRVQELAERDRKKRERQQELQDAPSTWQRIRGLLEPETGRGTAGLVGASLVPGVGEAIDAADFAAGFQDRDLSRMGWAAGGLLFPFVAGSTLRKVGEGVAKKWIDTTGDVVTGDTVRFKEGVFSPGRRGKYLGERNVTAKIVGDSYGGKKQQHTFSLEVIDSDGFRPLEPGMKTRRKGRNVYRHGTERLEWADEQAREAVAAEKHERGGRARVRRDQRRVEEGWRR